MSLSSRIVGLAQRATKGSSSNGALSALHTHTLSGLKRKRPHAMSPETLNENVRATEYAVRGQLVIRAEQLNKALAGGEKLPFDEIIYCNIGNPQQLQQPPITFIRQVLACVECPDLLQESFFPSDVRSRASEILQTTLSSGAYTHSQGLEYVRKHVAEFITKRDGYESLPSNIFLSDGASPAVKGVLNMLIRHKWDGLMIPIPQYPLYTAGIALYGGAACPYYLDEENGWALTIDELDRSYEKAHRAGINVRALAIINPGNPTGQCLSVECMQEIIAWADKKSVVLMADEVYQENVYVKDKKPFVSFKKALMDMGPDFEHVELFSFHSVSKGFIGECGKRGGYLEATNVHPGVLEEMYKINSVSLCPNVIGQIVVDCMVNPPKEGDESYPLYNKEKTDIYDSLKRRAELLVETLNSLEGVTCNPAEGAMYTFPQIRLPKGVIDAAGEAGMLPDTFYCMELLANTGICAVPGSGFGQKDGTFHFRTTFLPREDKIEKVSSLMKNFHKSFLAKYQ